MLKVRTRYGAFTSYPYRFDVCSSRLPYLQEVGELTALAPHTSSRSNLPSYLFFIVTDGAGSFKYLGKEYELSVGDAVFIDCSDKLIRDTLGSGTNVTMQNAEKTCYPAICTIAREMSLSVSTVKRAISDLEKNGFLRKKQRWRENGGRSSLLYEILK